MPESKNIVICLDGTGNQIRDNQSNVLKLYRTLYKNDQQLVFYDQGVGTLTQTLSWGRWMQKVKLVLGLAFGFGLDRNVLQAYEFLVNHYAEYDTKDEKGDEIRDNIYIFGFSRGAHTARVLAALVYEIGLLRPEQIHLAKAALMAYKQSVKGRKNKSNANSDTDESAGVNFRRITGTQTVSIKLLGLFDTVSSVFVPNPVGFFPPLIREKLPHTSNNPCVQSCRHALAIDDRRRMFRVDHWEPNQIFKPHRFASGTPENQDASEVWFSGYHSDVGGGLERKDSGLAQFPLIWMLEQAKTKGLNVNERMAEYVTGIKPYSSQTKYEYPKPEVTANVHDSMTMAWKILEYLPKHVSKREWPKRGSFLNYYLPRSEPRVLKAGTEVHSSAHERVEKVPGYKPENLD